MKEFVKKFKILYKPLYYCKKIWLFVWLEFCKCYSQKHQNHEQSIRKLKDGHLGERCFIVATGPSLTIEDLERIKNEYSISMNSIVSIFNKTTYRPSLYMIQDGRPEKKFREVIKRGDFAEVTIGVGNAMFREENIDNRIYEKYYKKFRKYNLDSAYHFFDMCYSIKKPQIYFSEKCDLTIYDGYTVTFSAIQLACYMGFKEIYLLGCDTNFAGHVGEKENIQSGVQETASRLIDAYKVAKDYADQNGIQIYNATRGGMLEVFPRVQLEDIVNDI